VAPRANREEVKKFVVQIILDPAWSAKALFPRHRL